jgi:NMD protein affecting ribosome stability and mRNA decay
MPKNIFVDLRRTQLHQFKEPARIDPYHSDMKEKGNPQCSDCGATQLKGRWVKMGLVENPSSLRKIKCNACRQMQDRYALGVVELSLDESRQDSQEILRTLKRSETVARNRNDQQRILWINQSPDSIKVYVTLPELARHMGRELKKTFKGDIEYLPSNESTFLRVRWRSHGMNLEDSEKLVSKSKAFRRRGQG